MSVSFRFVSHCSRSAHRCHLALPFVYNFVAGAIAGTSKIVDPLKSFLTSPCFSGSSIGVSEILTFYPLGAPGRLPTPTAQYPQLMRHDSSIHRCRQDAYATGYRQVSRSKLPHRHLARFPVERLADLGRVQLVKSFKTIVAQEGCAHTYTFIPFVVSHVGSSGSDGCTEVWLCALTPVSGSEQFTYSNDAQVSSLLCCSKLPSVPPNCMCGTSCPLRFRIDFALAPRMISGVKPSFRFREKRR